MTKSRALVMISVTCGLGAALAVAGCGGGGGGNVSKAQIRSVNAIPDGGTGTVVMNGGTLAQQNFFTSSGYQDAPVGAATFSPKLSVNPAEIYVTTTENLAATKYTAVLLGLASAKTGAASPRLVLFSDADTEVPLGFARVRYVQAAPDFANIQADITATGASVGNDLFYAGVTPYRSLPAGTYTIEYDEHHTGNPLAPPVNIPFEAGHRYTVFLTEPFIAPTRIFAVQSLDDGM